MTLFRNHAPVTHGYPQTLLWAVLTDIKNNLDLKNTTSKWKLYMFDCGVLLRIKASIQSVSVFSQMSGYVYKI